MQHMWKRNNISKIPANYSTHSSFNFVSNLKRERSMLTCFSNYLQRDELPAEFIFIATTAFYINLFL
uniref:Uncharacterized protein n=1 Tax=Geospiza parvula TaxID=87175 RepID=A0A8C3Q9H0_GEOPR